MGKIISFEEAGKEQRRRQFAEAYRWADKKRIEEGFVGTQPARVDDTVASKDGFTVAFFYDEVTGKALLFRSWDDLKAIQFNPLVNFDQLREESPEFLERMLQNGVKVSEHWMNAR